MKAISTFLCILATSAIIYAQDATPLTESKFDVLRKEIVGQSFDSKRLVKAKELSDNNFLYVRQIQAIMEGFSLESSRLDYAKYAYSTVLDAENYNTLIAMFKLGTSKDALKTYLAQRKAPVVPKEEKKAVLTEKEEGGSEKVTATPQKTKPTGPTPMTDQEFATAKRQIGEESFESSKLRRAKQTSDANYLLCHQIKEIMEVLSFESSRLEYAQYAYSKTYDQVNYATVKESLKLSKSKEELTAFLKKQPIVDYAAAKEEEALAIEEPITEEKEAAQLPPAFSKGDFINAKNEIASQSSDAKKLEKAKEITNKTYLLSEQVKTITALFLFEDNRLDYAKYAYAKTSDPEHFDLVRAVLEKESHKVLDDYIKNVNEANQVTTLATGPSELSSEDFEALKKRITGSALESHKLEKAKKIVDRSSLSAMQVKQINDLFELEETRLEFAKYAYTKTLDKEAYGLVREALGKSTNKYALDRFIKELGN
ncbi:DUF4476 domain-containing protein [Aureispira anguillae]|uniref:DUF4476 domain-containing protein n=1 Tax=Aureispira anguillae TaxID=2864201 RepID=A0A915YAX1_9BACT|nr:DUF4476 domain-containing protein [Aureispira anguillae]BDS09420.1 DUF4476 domain-containing protein [Aureispira anguillae]